MCVNKRESFISVYETAAEFRARVSDFAVLEVPYMYTYSALPNRLVCVRRLFTETKLKLPFHRDIY